MSKPPVARTTVSINPAVMAAAEQRQLVLYHKTFSAYVQDLILKDLRSSGMDPAAPATPHRNKKPRPAAVTADRD